MSGKPFLIVALAGDELVATAALSSAAADVWTMTFAGGSFPVVGEARVRQLLDRLHGYEREDPETGGPLPPGVEGYRLGRR